jgi:hypothetical protein
MQIMERLYASISTTFFSADIFFFTKNKIAFAFLLLRVSYNQIILEVSKFNYSLFRNI